MCVPFIYEKLAKSCGNKLRQQTQQTICGRGISKTRKQAKSTEDSRQAGGWGVTDEAEEDENEEENAAAEEAKAEEDDDKNEMRTQLGAGSDF